MHIIASVTIRFNAVKSFTRHGNIIFESQRGCAGVHPEGSSSKMPYALPISQSLPYASFTLSSCGKRLWASTCLSVRPHGKTWLTLDGFSWNYIFDFFLFENVSENL